MRIVSIYRYFLPDNAPYGRILKIILSHFSEQGHNCTVITGYPSYNYRENIDVKKKELERLYMEPQVELHASSVYSKVCTKGAKELFKDAGVLVLTNKKVPQGKEYKKPQPSWGWGGGFWGGGIGFGFAGFGGLFGGLPMPAMSFEDNKAEVPGVLRQK